MSQATGRTSTRVLEGSPSVTAELAGAVSRLRRAGRQVIDLAQGEVADLPTPEHVKEAARQALRDDQTRYAPTSGTLELREAIAMSYRRDLGLPVDPSCVMASAGAKQCVANFMMAVLNPGDEVLVPVPYWVSYLNQVALAGGRPRPVPTNPQDDYKLTGQAVREAVSTRTRALVLNNPNNPSGAVYSRSELERILDAALAAKLLVLSDEVYHHLTYGDAVHTCFAAIAPEAAEITVTVNAVSKTYCMTGWRLGYASGPADVISGMEQIQSHCTSSPNTVAQCAARAALLGDQSCVADLRTELDARRKLAWSIVRDASGVSTPLPSGAFYLFPRVGDPSEPAGDGFARALLEATEVLVAPGQAFGMPHHIRICFGASRVAITEGLARLAGWHEGQHRMQDGR